MRKYITTAVMALFIIAAPIIFVVITTHAPRDVKDTAVNRYTSADAETVFVIKVTGTTGLKYSGSYGVYDRTGQSTSKSVDGTVPASYVARGNIVSVYFQKKTQAGSMTVQILKDDRVVNSSFTTAEYGVVTLATQ